MIIDRKQLRIIFMGTPEFAVGTLKTLVNSGYNVVAVVTQPDKPVGRHHDTLQPSEVKKYALEHGIPVLQPEKMKDPAFIEALKQYNADLQVVVAFRMLPEVVWSMPKYGTFNVHASLLPQYRGAAPINWAVINGETETGVTTFFLDRQIDTGKVILQKHFQIPCNADVEYVYNGLMELGAEAAVETVEQVLRYGNEVPAIPQEQLIAQLKENDHNEAELVLKPAPKIFKETCQIDWNKPAKDVHNFVRGLSPYPGAWTELTLGCRQQTLKIFKTAMTNMQNNANEAIATLKAEGQKLYIACADLWIEILELQMPGKKRMSATAFINGNRNIINHQS